ncbi:MAG: IS30 family transposase [Clostridiales bacterium]|jgi:IS30 family transposase|nr:IS30 family transposase [Clostridiales bacterium]
MTDYKLASEKHLTLEARQEIEECLNLGISFKDIARRVGKSPTTISREVKKHLSIKESWVVRTKGDGSPIYERPCPNLMKAPYVCNACEKQSYNRCSYRKQFYRAKKAHEEYEFTLVDSREGIPLNKQEFHDADAVISKAIKKGQRMYHIMQTYDVGISMSSAYRYLHKDYLSIDKLDMPRVPKFKARKQYRVPGVPKAAKIGKTYADFRAYIDEHEIRHWVEMDTVIGRVGGKVIMTFNFTQMNFMFGLLLNDKTSAEAAAKIRTLKKHLFLADARFGDIFPILLTDNGGEFSNVAAFTDDAPGLPTTKLYFCDPYCSSQKPKVEKNHTIFRDIVPKGESFDDFSQDMVNVIFSHVNSSKRKSLNGKSPFEAFVYFFNEETASLLGISHIPAEDVIQDKRLIKKIKKALPSSERQSEAVTLS